MSDQRALASAVSDYEARTAKLESGMSECGPAHQVCAARAVERYAFVPSQQLVARVRDIVKRAAPSPEGVTCSHQLEALTDAAQAEVRLSRRMADYRRRGREFALQQDQLVTIQHGVESAIVDVAASSCV